MTNMDVGYPETGKLLHPRENPRKAACIRLICRSPRSKSEPCLRERFYIFSIHRILARNITLLQHAELRNQVCSELLNPANLFLAKIR